jgi:hypothetical protein
MVGECGKVVFALVSIHALDLYVSFFKMTMGHNFDPILHEESGFNPLIRMWCKVSGSPLLNHKFLEFIKLVEIIVVQVFGSIKNQHTFNIVAFMKTKLQN